MFHQFSSTLIQRKKIFPFFIHVALKNVIFIYRYKHNKRDFVLFITFVQLLQYADLISKNRFIEFLQKKSFLKSGMTSKSNLTSQNRNLFAFHRSVEKFFPQIKLFICLNHMYTNWFFNITSIECNSSVKELVDQHSFNIHFLGNNSS